MAGTKPHLVILLADNLGWANVGYHRPPGVDPHEYATPNIDALASSGIELDRHYTYKFCSPSRSSLLSGRLPFHVNIYNDDPAMEGQGVPTNMTLISDKLSTVGYATHFIGKWHVGMASRSQNPPEARGFDTSFGYFHSTNSYYSSLRAEGCVDSTGTPHPATDLWDTGAPSDLNGSAYEERLFAQRAVELIQAHDVRRPFFLYYAFHTSWCGGTTLTIRAVAKPLTICMTPAVYARQRRMEHDGRCRRRVGQLAARRRLLCARQLHRRP